MPRVGRYVKMVARDGKGDELAEKMLLVAEMLEEAPGCELYVINRAPEEADAIWVTEIWRSQAELVAAISMQSEKVSVEEVLGLLSGQPERTDVWPIGGVGLGEPD